MGRSRSYRKLPVGCLLLVSLTRKGAAHVCGCRVVRFKIKVVSSGPACLVVASSSSSGLASLAT